MKGGKNAEGFNDPTATIAIGNVMRRQRMIDWYDKKNNPAAHIARLQKEKGISRSEAEKIVREQVPQESKFQKKVRDAVSKAYPGGFIVKIQQGQYSRGGIPDLMVIVNGHYFGFEIKRPYFNKKSKLQTQTINQIRDAGGTASFVSYPEEAIGIIEDYFRKRKVP